MFQVTASMISSNIEIDSFAAVCSYELLYSDHTELFYEVDTELYVSIFRYGVVCFFNFDEPKASELIRRISDHCDFFYDSELNKAYQININAQKLNFGYTQADLTYFDIETLRIVMLNIAQTVALDYYFQKSRSILSEINQYTSLLEKTGKLTISDKKLKKIMLQTHTIKNEILENLHVFDLIQETTKNKYLIEIDLELKKALYIKKRTHCVQEGIENIEEHLEYFNTLVEHSAFMKAEWIWTALLATFAVDIAIRDVFYELIIYLKKLF